MNLKKTKLSFLIPILLLVVFYPASQSKADIAFDQNGKWETTFDCPEWEASQSNYQPGCDNISLGDWCGSCEEGVCRYSQITDSANMTNDNGKGFRMWVGDGKNNNSSNTSLIFPCELSEIWVRYYMKYPKGFSFDNVSSGHKLLYTKGLYINYEHHPLYPNSQHLRAVYNGQIVARNYDGKGFFYVNGGLIGDGKWHLYEMHIKYGNPGIIEVRIDNEKIFSENGVDLSQVSGTSHALIPSNMGTIANGRCMPIDIDNLIVYNQTPPNLDSQGNPFIGPIGWGEEAPPLPGDLNSDGTVNIFDYNIFLQNFGATDCDNIADLNNDCNVNIFDYNIFLENFGRSA